MKKKMKSLLLMAMAAVCAFALTACSSEPSNPVAGNTYTFESASVDGEAMDATMATLFEGSKYAFNDDDTCMYTVSMFGMTTEVNGTYKVEDDKVTVTLDYGEEGTVDMVFTIADDKITFSETMPAYDDNGEPIEGQTTTTEQVYAKDN